MAQTESKAYRGWMARLEDDIWPESWCRAWCRVVVPVSRGKSPQSGKSNVTMAEARALRLRMRERAGVGIFPEHARKGRTWIRNNARRLNLPADIATATEDSISGFRFMGNAYDIGNDYRSHYIPVWRMFLYDGRVYDYAAAAWQSGDGIYWREVVK